MASAAGARLTEANQDQRELAVSGAIQFEQRVLVLEKTDRPGESHWPNVSAKGMPKPRSTA
jgi:hypothetical protein